MLNKTKSIIINFPKLVSVGAINIYQVLLSPDHSWLKGRFPHGYCRFYPSCSEYGKQSIIRFGLFRGLWLSAKRLLRCHPWADPKIDLIPN